MQPESETAAIQLVTRYNEALNAGDVDAMMSMMTADCLFENTDPPPDGDRFLGQAAVRSFWEAFFRSSRQPHIEIEEISAWNERCVMRWVYRWQEADGSQGHVRGIDLYHIQDGLIQAKRSYVKG